MKMGRMEIRPFSFLERELVFLQAELVAHGEDFLLRLVVDGHAHLLAQEPGQVFLFAGGVDALFAGGFSGGAERAEETTVTGQ